MAPAQGQRCQRNEGVDASAATVTTPENCLQGCQHSAGKDASSAMTMCCEQHCQWAEASVTSAMTPAGQRQQRPCTEGKKRQPDASSDAYATRAMTPAQRWQRCQRTPVQRRQKRQLCNNDVWRAALQLGRSQQNGGNDASAWRVKMPAQCWQ